LAEKLDHHGVRLRRGQLRLRAGAPVDAHTFAATFLIATWIANVRAARNGALDALARRAYRCLPQVPVIGLSGKSDVEACGGRLHDEGAISADTGRNHDHRNDGDDAKHARRSADRGNAFAGKPPAPDKVQL